MWLREWRKPPAGKRPAGGCSEVGLEVQAQTEFDHARAGVLGVREILVSGRRLAEVGGTQILIGLSGQLKIGQVEDVEEVRSEVDAHPLRNMRLLHEAQVKVVLPRSPQKDLVAELARGELRSDVGRVRIEIGGSLAVDPERGVGIVNERLRQVGHDSRSVR